MSTNVDPSVMRKQLSTASTSKMRDENKIAASGAINYG
jgi:hypothetical protein